MSTLQIGTARALPGHKAWGQLRVREGRKQVRLPVVAINGRKDGEHVVVLANQHGGEYNGVEAIRRFCEEADARYMSGTVIAIPSANPLAAMLMNEFYPEDEPRTEIPKYRGGGNRGPEFDRHTCPYNMNRRWPGKKGGGLLVDRMVYEIWHRAVMAPHRTASLLLDIHCHQSPSAVYATFREDVDVGVASGIRNIIFTRSATKPPHRPYSRIACYNAGIQALTIELGGQRTFNPVSVEDGRLAIFNLLEFWGVLPGPRQYPDETLILDPWRNDIEERQYARPSYMAYNARNRGLVFEYKSSYDRVRKGELVCHVTDPFTGRIAEECRAPMTGALYTPRRAEAPCEKGDRLFAVSIVKKVRPGEYVKRLDAEYCRRHAPRNST